MVLAKTSSLTVMGPLTWPPHPGLHPPGPRLFSPPSPPPSSHLCSYYMISGQQSPLLCAASHPPVHTHTLSVSEPLHLLSLCPNALPSPALLANCLVSFRNQLSQPPSSRSLVACCFMALRGPAQASVSASASLPALFTYRQGLSYSRCMCGVYTGAGPRSWSKRARAVHGYIFG